MKKIFALVLAAMMILSAVSVLAEGSKGGGDIHRGTVISEEDNITLKKIDDTEETQAVKDAITKAFEANGNALEGVPEDVRSQVPEGLNTINAMDTYVMEGYTGKSKKAILVFTFDSPYEKDEKVTVLIAIAPAGQDVEWLVLEGTGNEDGDVEVPVTETELKKINENPFVAIPVSK